MEHYRTLCASLLDDGHAVAIIGLNGDKPFGTELVDHCRSPYCVDLTGYTKTVRHLLALFHHASLLVTNDGGPGQFAAVTPVPTIILFGPETPVLYGTLSRNSHCFHLGFPCSPCLTAYNHRTSPCDGDNQCLKQITPERRDREGARDGHAGAKRACAERSPMTPGVISEVAHAEIAPGVLCGWRPCSRCSHTSTASTASTSRRTATNIPYEHITRMTAASGHWLPLQSELPDMRNTKPPLLFWQGIASTNWGKRLDAVEPAMAERDLHAADGWPGVPARLEVVGIDSKPGLIALLTFLAFFSTYRYGRPFLTDAPSVFWLFVPLRRLLYLAAHDPRIAPDCSRPARVGDGCRAALQVVCAAAAGRALSRVVVSAPPPVSASGAFLARDAGKLAILASWHWRCSACGSRSTRSARDRQ